MKEIERLLYKELYRKSLYDFVKDFWNCADPAKFVDGFLPQFYCEVFQYMCRKWTGYNAAELDMQLPPLSDDISIIDIRNNKQNVNINVPPRHSKSMIFNVLGPVWLWLNAPVKVASVSHTTSLAGEMNNKRIRILNSEKFKYFFGDEVWLESTPRGTLIDKRGGELYSIARESFTGHGADIIINDDLTNAETARRDREEMISAWSYYQNTMPSRINDRNNYIIMNIQQRLAPNDITGHILSEPKLAAQYSFIVLPAVFKKTTYIVCPISGHVFKFNPGNFLWPERFGNYQALRYEVGETVFETQYLQNPIASDKTVIKESMIVEKDLKDCPSIEMADMIYASHDFPVKDKDTSDFLGSVLAYRVGSNLYIKDCLEKRMAFVKSVEYVQQLDTLFPGIIQVIEDKANGSPILQQLQDKVSGMQAFQPGTASKMQRLESASLYMTAGNVIFIRSKLDVIQQKYDLTDSLKNLKSRLMNFPFVEHDDITDAFSMLVLFTFMDRRYMVYGRAFNDKNLFYDDINEKQRLDNETVFFNKEGDKWKVCKIAVHYGLTTSLYVTHEVSFKASVEEGISKMKEFAKDKLVFIDCSATDGLQGMFQKSVSIERYEDNDFDKTVSNLNLAFAKNQIMVSNECRLVRADIENFKFSKSKDDSVKYVTTKDGFVACLRIAMKYFGGIC